MKSCSTVGKISWILVIVGALNWGLVAINPEWNVVNVLLGGVPALERIIYGLVGLAGVCMLTMCCNKK